MKKAIEQTELLSAALDVLEDFVDRFGHGDEGLQLAATMMLDAQLQAARVVLAQVEEMQVTK